MPSSRNMVFAPSLHIEPSLFKTPENVIYAANGDCYVQAVFDTESVEANRGSGELYVTQKLADKHDMPVFDPRADYIGQVQKETHDIVSGKYSEFSRFIGFGYVYGGEQDEFKVLSTSPSAEYLNTQLRKIWSKEPHGAPLSFEPLYCRNEVIEPSILIKSIASRIVPVPIPSVEQKLLVDEQKDFWYPSSSIEAFQRYTGKILLGFARMDHDTANIFVEYAREVLNHGSNIETDPDKLDIMSQSDIYIYDEDSGSTPYDYEQESVYDNPTKDFMYARSYNRDVHSFIRKLDDITKLIGGVGIYHWKSKTGILTQSQPLRTIKKLDPISYEELLTTHDHATISSRRKEISRRAKALAKHQLKIDRVARELRQQAAL